MTKIFFKNERQNQKTTVGLTEYGMARFHELSGEESIGAIRNLPGIPGINLLVSKMRSRAYNVWKGAYFQAKRTMAYFREGKLQAVEFRLGVGAKRGDILLKDGLRVECKSWPGWGDLSPGIKNKRLAELEQQIADYLHPTGSRMLLEFDGAIPPDVLTKLTEWAQTYNGGQFGNRLFWNPIT
jgi:hypothetical protein